MKSSAAIVAGLSVLLGMAAVLAFRDPARPRQREATTPSRPVQADPTGPSRRVSIAGTPAGAARATEPEHTVDARWGQRNKDAIADLEAGRLVQAVDGFTACAQAVPDEPVFRRNLAEALARLATERWDRGGTEGQREAVVHMARAADLAPEREDVKKRLEEMRALLGSEQGHWTDSSGHFDLSYDGSRDDLAFRTAEVLDALESSYFDLTELFGLDPVASGRARIRVVLYKREGFHDATGIGHWAGGLYDGSIRMPLENLGQERATMRRVLRHELVHVFVHESGGRDVPGWLNEGLAQLLETPDPAELGRSLDAARAKLRGQTPRPLDDLKGSLGAVGDAEAIARAYAQSLLFLDFLSREQGDRVPFEMVAGCKEPGGPAGAFERRTGLPLATAFDDFAARVR